MFLCFLVSVCRLCLVYESQCNWLLAEMTRYVSSRCETCALRLNDVRCRTETVRPSCDCWHLIQNVWMMYAADAVAMTTDMTWCWWRHMAVCASHIHSSCYHCSRCIYDLLPEVLDVILWSKLSEVAVVTVSRTLLAQEWFCWQLMHHW